MGLRRVGGSSLVADLNNGIWGKKIENVFREEEEVYGNSRTPTPNPVKGRPPCLASYGCRTRKRTASSHTREMRDL